VSRYYADLNPHWPSKGERKYCLFDRAPDGTVYRLNRQFNSLKPAERVAYELEVKSERARNRRIYVGD
jgi:hypothetical protein